MLFNSFEFIFLFLPATLIGYFWIARSASHRLAALWLTVSSLFFYGWWNAKFVLLLVASIAFNYTMGYAIGHARNASRAKTLLVTALVANLALLGVFKYTNFFISAVVGVTGASIPLTQIVLPLGISFFTFTQIAFLVDVYRGIAREYNFIHYSLFVSYFPHLIAGPVLHHAEMMPQFERPTTYRLNFENISVGTTIFVIGLFKKVILADGVGFYVGPVFGAAASGVELTLIEAWGGALAYTLQLYFDFSGYSDMAIGLSRLFGVTLPLNFHSPYKATSIIDFWHQWHMTLSRFLRDYLYFPLGGNRLGRVRRYVNLLVTMVLGGLWHGAGWTFVLWGTLHGFYLVINHGWRAVRRSFGNETYRSTRGSRALACLITFLAVVVSWVVFRANSLDAAVTMLKSMAGFNGLVLPLSASELGQFGQWLASQGVRFSGASGLVDNRMVAWIVILLAMVWFAPNTQQLLGKYRPALAQIGEAYCGRFTWRPSWPYALLVAALAVTAVLSMQKHSEFLYFQF